MEKIITRVITSVIITILLLTATFGSFYKVEDGEQVIVERFGEKVKLVKETGLKFKVPFIDSVKKIKTDETYTVQYGYRATTSGNTKEAAEYSDVPNEAIVLTKGSYIVNVEAMIQYKITEADEYYYNVDEPVDTLLLAFESVLRRNVQNKDIDDALLNKGIISNETLPELKKKIADYGLGIEVKSLQIQNISLPGQVKDAYADVINARNEQERLLDQAQKYKNEKIPNARAEAYSMVQEAEGYKADKTKSAEGDVARFKQVYEKYKVAKDITKTRLRLETMEKILKTVKDKNIIDLDGEGTIKYLPINPSSTSKGGNN